MDLFKPFKKKVEYVEKPILLSSKNQDAIYSLVTKMQSLADNRKEMIKKQQTKLGLLDQYADSVCTKTIFDWRTGLEAARNIEKPNRFYLLDLYAELKLDSFLDSAVNIQKAMLKSVDRVVEINGVVNENYSKLFNSSWFDSIMDGYVEADLQGFCLFEIQKIVKEGDIWNIEDVIQINPKNVVPEYKGLKKQQYNYTQGDYSYSNNDYIIEIIIDNPRNLGKLSKLAPLMIYKKLALGQWSQFLETYGIPSMVVKSAIKDTAKEEEFMKELDELGGAIKILLAQDDSAEFLQPSSVDAYQTFMQMINLVDETIANEIIGGSSLLKTGNNGSYALSNNHMGITILKRKNDLKIIERITNTTIIPKLKRLGVLPDDQIKFSFGDVENLTKAEQIEIDSRLLQYMELNIDYLQQKYKVKIDKYKDGSGLQLNSEA